MSGFTDLAPVSYALTNRTTGGTSSRPPTTPMTPLLLSDAAIDAGEVAALVLTEQDADVVVRVLLWNWSMPMKFDVGVRLAAAASVSVRAGTRS